MQTRCTLVQCRTPREVRYLSSKANSFPRSIVFPGAIAFSTHAKPPTVVPCQRTTTVCTCSRPPGNPKAYHSPTQHCPLSREGRVGKNKKLWCSGALCTYGAQPQPAANHWMGCYHILETNFSYLLMSPLSSLAGLRRHQSELRET